METEGGSKADRNYFISADHIVWVLNLLNIKLYDSIFIQHTVLFIIKYSK